MRYKKRGLPIPVDVDHDNIWANGYCQVSFCIPNTQSYRAMVDGLVLLLARGRFYDATTGNIKDAQKIGYEVYRTLCMTCSDDIKLSLALQKLLVATLHDGVLHSDSYYLTLNDSSQSDDIDVNSAILSNNTLYPDMSVADALLTATVKHTLDTPSPLTTTIQDDLQSLNSKVDSLNSKADTLNGWLNTLQSRFMVDGWIFNTNIATVLNNTLRLGRTPTEYLSESPSISDLMSYYFSKEDTSSFAPKYQSIFGDMSLLNDGIVNAISGVGVQISTLLAPLQSLVTGQSTTNSNLATIGTRLATIDNTLENNNQLLISSLNNLDFCCSNETDKVVEALGLLSLAIQDMSVTAIANAGNNVLINAHGSTGSLVGGDIDNCCDGSTGSGVIGNNDIIDNGIVNRDDCSWVDNLIDAIITVLDYVEYGIVTYGVSKLIILSAKYLWPLLKTYSYFSRALAFVNATLLAGIDPSDALTIGNLILEELVVAFILNYSDTLISEIKQYILSNRQTIKDLLCDDFDVDNPDNIDTDSIAEKVSEYFVSEATEIAIKEAVKKMLKYALSSRKTLLIKRLK